MQNLQQKGWVRFTEYEDTLLSFELLVDQLTKVQTSDLVWKWIIISLHSTLQGLMVLNLQSSNGMEALKPINNRTKVSHNKFSRKLDYFLELYGKIQHSNAMTQHINGKKFITTQKQNECMEELNAYRNNFIHYLPKRSLIVSLETFTNILSECTIVIDFLVTNKHFGHYGDRFNKLCISLHQNIRDIKSHYAEVVL